MGIGLSGMISGMDTDSIVKALVSAQRTKATKIENKITLNKWTTDAWSALNTKIYSFYTKYASKLRMQGTYMSRSANSSNESIVKATASTSAAVGTHTLTVSQLASSQYVTGRKLSNTADTYNRNTKLTDLGTAAGTIITIKGKQGTGSEKEVKLEVDGNTTINDFLKACKDAGLNASFDEKQQRFFISSSASGLEDAFSITTSALDPSAEAAFGVLDSLVDKSKMSESEKTSYENARATLRQNTKVLKEVLDGNITADTADKKQKEVLDAIETIKKISVDQEAEKQARGNVEAANRDIINNAGAGGTFSLYDTDYEYDELYNKANESLETAYQYKATKDAMNALKDALKNSGDTLGDAYADPSKIVSYQQIEDAEAVRNDLITNNKLDSIDVTNADDLDVALANETLTQDEVDALKLLNTWEYNDGVDVQAVYQNSYDTEKDIADPATHENRIKDAMYATVLEDKDNAAKYNEAVAKEKADLLADTTGTGINDTRRAEIDAELSKVVAAGDGTTSSANGLNDLGLGEITGTAVAQGADASGMVVIAAADAEFELDGVSMTETSNNFTVNGLTLELVSTSTDPVQITVGKDASATYDFIKEAITEYNKLIEEMNTLYNAKSSRGYDPLTSEQKEAMSESDIEAWEKKIKDSLLRRDETLGGLLTGMRTALSSTYTNADGKTFSLSTFGIVTGNYTEYGQLHIYGDEDDSTYAEYTDRLKKALEDNPDDVMEALSSIFGNLYTTMQEKCAAKKDISSALTFYNDKSYNKALEGYEKDLKKMEQKIKDLEDRYYKQFTAMETALAKLQSQTNSLAAMLGTGSNQ